MQRREPIVNAPTIVLCLLGAFLAMHLLRWALPAETENWLTAALAFIPGRFAGLAAELPGGQPAVVTQFVTHLFVHGDLTHLVINSAWLLVFGTPVARRTDTLRFLAFFLVTGIAGALIYLAIKGPVPVLVIGASGAISGLMGGAFRFLFAGLAPVRDEDAGRDVHAAPLTPLLATLGDRRIMMAVAAWGILNVALAWGAAGLIDAAGIAWEAHLGGFFAGLLLYGWFDRQPGDAEKDAAPAA